MLEARLLDADELRLQAPSLGSPASFTEPLRIRTTAEAFAASEGRSTRISPVDEFPESPAEASAHSADASVSVQGTAHAPAASSSSIVPLFTLDSMHATAAEALDSGPLFGRASAESIVDWSGEVASMASDDMERPAMAAPVGSTLALDWTFDLLGLGTQEFNAAASIRQRVTVVQSSGTETRTDQLEFSITSLNNEATIQSMGSVPFDAADWLQTNVSSYGPVLGILDEPSTSLQAFIPLLDVDTDAEQSIELTIYVEHQEASEEIPPAAAAQSGTALGNVGPQHDADAPMLTWDPSTGRLEIDAIPITQLWAATGVPLSTAVMQEDSLQGGLIEIDPLRYIGESAGLRYFEGGQMRLLDTTGQALMLAKLPTLVYDPNSGEANGFTFFAPIMSITETSLSSSPQLREFLTGIEFWSPTAPALFFGTPAAGTLDWSAGFAREATGLLSFAGGDADEGIRPTSTRFVSTPASGLLLLLGWATLWLGRRAQDRVPSTPRGHPTRLEDIPMLWLSRPKIGPSRA